MATLLFITPQELTNTTIIGGNVDIDKYRMNIENVQVTVIEPLLGSELFDKIIALVTASTIGDTGNELYNTIYTEFVKPITKNEALSEYITVSGFSISNAGALKNIPDNSELMDKDEKALISTIYSSKADMYVQRFYDWICLNSVPEYKTSQDEVNASKSINNTGGWYFSSIEPTLYE